MSGLKQWIRSRTTLPRSVMVLSLISFTVAVGFGVMLPVLPVFAQSFDVGPFGASAVVSAFAFARLIGAPLVGPMINRFGERTVLSVGMFLVAGSTAVSALSSSYLEFLSWRTAGGIGSAMFTVSAMTLVLNSVEPHQRGRASGMYMGGFLVGGMAGPGIGGMLATISITAPFFVYAAALAVAGVIGIVVLRSSPRPGVTAAGAPGPKVRPNRRDRRRAAAEVEGPPFSTVLRDVRYQAALIAGLGQGWNSFGVRSALIPLLVVEVLDRDPVWSGIAFTVSAVVQTLMLAPAGRFVDTVGRRPALIGAGLVCALGMIGVAFAANVWLLTLALSVYAIGAAFQGTAPAASVGDSAGGRSGTPVAVFSMVTDLGAILGPLAGGWIAAQGSYPLAFGAGVLILLAGSAVALRMPREPAPAGDRPGSGTPEPAAPLDPPRPEREGEHP